MYGNGELDENGNETSWSYWADDMGLIMIWDGSAWVASLPEPLPWKTDPYDPVAGGPGPP